jgi:hypothetical protein
MAHMRTNPQTKTSEVEHHTLRIRSIITNIGKEAVTVPTSSFDGGPGCWSTGQDHYGICFVVGYRYINHKQVTPSPARFFPILLEPGESTELTAYEAEISHPELLKKVSVEFEVQEDYALTQKWWYGDIRGETDVKHGKPNQPPLQTPTSGTPAAGAPVAPPSGAAGR